MHMLILNAIVIARWYQPASKMLLRPTASALAFFLLVETGCQMFSTTFCSINLQVIIPFAYGFEIWNGIEETEVAPTLFHFIVITMNPSVVSV